MEKRVPVAIVVHLARAEDHTAGEPEVTYTDNISAHGACVISSHPWKSGEIADVTSLNDRITLRGRVAHCAKREAGRYDVGLYFDEQEVTWNPYNQTHRPSTSLLSSFGARMSKTLAVKR